MPVQFVRIAVLFLTAPPKFLCGRFIWMPPCPFLTASEWRWREVSNVCERVSEFWHFGFEDLLCRMAQREPLSFLPLSLTLSHMRSHEKQRVSGHYDPKGCGSLNAQQSARR